MTSAYYSRSSWRHMLSRLCSGYIPIHPYQIETKDVITSKKASGWGEAWPFLAQWLLRIPQSFSIQIFYVLPTECIYVFCVVLRKNSTMCTGRWGVYILSHSRKMLTYRWMTLQDKFFQCDLASLISGFGRFVLEFFALLISQAALIW
jgi:hypothetical protein